MITFDYRLTAESRVSVGAGPQVTFGREALGVIPGSTIRGALATAYRRTHGFDWASSDLRDLFERHTWFSQAVPEPWNLTGMSCVRCKYPKNESCKAAAHDLALVVAEGRTPSPRCPACGGAWESGKGWGKPEGDERPYLVSAIRTQLEGGVAKEENLFTRQALETGTQLIGSVRIDDAVTPDSLDWLESEQDLRVGGQRSVLGAARWTTRGAADPPRVASLPSRVVLRCRSPLVVVDEHGAASMDPQSELRRVLGDRVAIIARWTRPARVAGWHMATGLPKPEDWALASGSTFVIEGAPGDLAARLAGGLGLRRREGYGELEIVDQPPADPQPEPEPALATREELRLLVDHVADGESPVETDAAEEVEPAAGEPVEPTEPPGPGESGAPGDENEAEPSLAGIVGAMGALVQVTPKTAINGLLSALTQVRLYRQNGFPSSIVANLVQTAMATPWARALPPLIAARVREVLSEEDPVRLAASHAEIRLLGQERGHI